MEALKTPHQRRLHDDLALLCMAAAARSRSARSSGASSSSSSSSSSGSDSKPPPRPAQAIPSALSTIPLTLWAAAAAAEPANKVGCADRARAGDDARGSKRIKLSDGSHRGAGASACAGAGAGAGDDGDLPHHPFNESSNGCQEAKTGARAATAAAGGFAAFSSTSGGKNYNGLLMRVRFIDPDPHQQVTHDTLFRYTLSMHALSIINTALKTSHSTNIHCRHTLSTHTINTLYQHTLSTHSINTFYQHTLSTHSINPPC